jgi:hypothetical protein
MIPLGNNIILSGSSNLQSNNNEISLFFNCTTNSNRFRIIIPRNIKQPPLNTPIPCQSLGFWTDRFYRDCSVLFLMLIIFSTFLVATVIIYTGWLFDIHSLNDSSCVHLFCLYLHIFMRLRINRFYFC